MKAKCLQLKMHVNTFKVSFQYTTNSVDPNSMHKAVENPSYYLYTKVTRLPSNDCYTPPHTANMANNANMWKNAELSYAVSCHPRRQRRDWEKVSTCNVTKLSRFHVTLSYLLVFFHIENTFIKRLVS